MSEFIQFAWADGTVWGITLQNLSTLFDLKIVYSYVIGVADSKSVLGLFSTALVSKIFAFYHLLKMHKVDQDVVVMDTLVNFF